MVDSFEHGCIAFACPVNNEFCKNENQPREFSKRGIAKRIEFKQLFVLNDFSGWLPFFTTNIVKPTTLQIGQVKPLKRQYCAFLGTLVQVWLDILLGLIVGGKTLDGEVGTLEISHQTMSKDIHRLGATIKEKIGRVAAEELLSGKRSG